MRGVRLVAPLFAEVDGIVWECDRTVLQLFYREADEFSKFVTPSTPA